MLTDKLFTGQREMAGLGIYHYQARFYSPKLGRFLSPDTIISGANSHSLNRYSYVLGNPLKYTDPTGHKECADTNDSGNCLTGTQVLTSYIQSKYKKVKFKGRWDEDGLLEVYSALTKISTNGFNGNTDAFNAAFGTLTFISVANGSLGTAGGEPAVGRADHITGIIRLTPNAVVGNVIHEMGHILDGNLRCLNPRAPFHSQEFVDKFNLGSARLAHARMMAEGGYLVVRQRNTEKSVRVKTLLTVSSQVLCMGHKLIEWMFLGLKS